MIFDFEGGLSHPWNFRYNVSTTLMEAKNYYATPSFSGYCLFEAYTILLKTCS